MSVKERVHVHECVHVCVIVHVSKHERQGVCAWVHVNRKKGQGLFKAAGPGPLHRTPSSPGLALPTGSLKSVSGEVGPQWAAKPPQRLTKDSCGDTERPGEGSKH